MTLKIPQEVLEGIRQQKAIRDRSALGLGAALAEFEMQRQVLDISSMPPQDRLTRLGALLDEFDGYKHKHIQVIFRSCLQQKKLGEEALEALGLPRGVREFTINEDSGDVLELIAGAWVPVKRAA